MSSFYLFWCWIC